MNAILSFLEGIGSAISGAFGFLLDLVLDIVYVVRLLGRILKLIPTFLSWLPPPILVILTAAISVAVIFKIIGR